MLSAISGARRSEVIALRWTDIELEHASMTIRRAIVVGPNGLVEKDTKTHSVRRVALDAGTVQMLAGYRDYIHTRAEQCDVELRPDCLVFATDIEMLTPCYPDSVSRRFRRACERAGVEGFEKIVAVKRILPHLSENKEFLDMFVDTDEPILS